MAYSDPDKRKAYAKAHYEANKALYIKRARVHAAKVRKERQDVVNKAKEEAGCADCGGFFPAVCMDFDHIADDKSDAVSKMVMDGRPWTLIEAEMAKCEVVCANCHRLRTSGRYARLSEAEWTGDGPSASS